MPASISGWLYGLVYNQLPKDSDFTLACIPLILSVICEIIVNGTFTFFDIKQYPWMDTYRIHYCESSLGARKYPSQQEIGHAIKVFFGNYFRIILPIHLVTITAAWFGYVKVSELRAPEQLNDWDVIKDFTLFVLFADLWNYSFHRLMHVPYFYDRFHRLHHEYVYTFVWANHAFHDLEIILFGMSVVVPPILFKTHLFTVWLFTAFTIFHTSYQHSGYVFPILRTSVFHDAHHYLVHKNFSSHTPFLDMIFGTYAQNSEVERAKYKVKKPYREAYPRFKSFEVGKTSLSA